jgi:excisionase family DNA binding protein
MTEQATQPRKLLTYGQTAERWNVSKRTVQRIVELGGVEVVDLGERMPRIPEEAADKYAAARIRHGKGDAS